MYSYRTVHGPVDLAFTDRLGGVSAAPYDELNLSIAGLDDEAATAENHRRLLTDFAPGVPYADLFQVHGDEVVLADPRSRPPADGIVTDRADLVLMVRTADCVPVLLADAAAGVIGAAHAGRRGMAAGVVTATVARMRGLGADRILAWLGPSVCSKCYEVPAEMAEEVAAIEPVTRARTAWGTASLDIAAGVRAQLQRASVEVSVDAERCTRESLDLYSYRRDGLGASLGAVIRLRSGGAA
ncbi:MAG: peptidoglycan editing factor PgeF [Nocardioides sp.]|uniref:peptidoglycan editing factor PgeF n=1 Tax=Nocardioides sp. TaxID=35761 RepID=UPI0039E6465E